MISLDSITNENNNKHNEKWPYIADHPYRIIIISGSGSGKTNVLLNLIKEQDYHGVIEKIHLYARDLGIKHVNNPNAFIVYSNTIDDVYEDINDYKPNSDKKVLIVFDYMIADIMSIKIKA